MKELIRNSTYKGIYALIILMLISSLFLFPIKVQAATTYTQTVKDGIDAFPDSYKKLLTNFIENTEHTNWNFQAYYTGINWSDFLAGESGKNMVSSSLDTAYRASGANTSGSWINANQDIVAYFMDPRNFINERNLFEFLDVSNSALYTRSIIKGMIQDLPVFNGGKKTADGKSYTTDNNMVTFTMDDIANVNCGQQVTIDYADIIMQAAKESQMSPISIVVKIVQEVGSSGSASVSGTYKASDGTDYSGYYNFFNVGANDTGDPIANGLSYAKKATKRTSADTKISFPNGWDNPYNSIIGGAWFNSDAYITAGQNTAYFYKFDCVGTKILNIGETQTIAQSDLYHQYMTNVMDPYTQSWSLFNTYTNNNLLDKPLNFIIPVFNNMPDVVYKPSSLSNSADPLYYANVSSNLTVRSNATTSYSTIMTLYKDDLVVMLKRNYATVSSVDGPLSLDQVKLWNGQTGYVATEYLEPFIKSGSSNQGPPLDSPSDTQAVEPNIGFGYVNVSSSLSVRSSDNSGATIIANAQPNEEMIILDDLDSGWYRVKLSSGVIGYVSKDSITRFEKIKIGDTQITVTPDITANYVAGRLNTSTYTIKNGAATVTGNILGTGYKFVVGDKEYDVVKLGDANGDGAVDAVDLLLLKRHLLGIATLNGLYYKAEDLDQNATLDAVDLLMLKRDLLNIYKLTL
ncbi:MAG: SH3 domain-containing protein [Oscillospiraceae bacterium]|nr:SH3 domain-containing protein [Oscillospiraceae bacterium]